MAEESEEAEVKAAGFPWIAIALVALFCGAGGAAGVIFLSPAPAATPTDAESEQSAKAQIAPFNERVLALDPFVVNVVVTRATRGISS